ncbi:hypothetical protein [Massilia glaciei]|uniref:Uncharacterized protein n=1 Tax=Massilia glaciei TaxID=1524097 RepID=A0A2U2I6I1_9BURK|nr:hypothetical protein [Massilia glaciei]PWF55357.1 hypothetical protein C7C56_002190 [Massilia glaciei]
MDKDTLGGLLLFAACMFAAYKLVKLLWPIFEQRKNLTPIQMVERAMSAPGEEMERQATVFGSWRRTIVVNVVNFVLLLGWCAFAAGSPIVLWFGLGYQCIGHLVIYAMHIKITAPLNLKLRDRIWIRVFYAWFWPGYLAYRRK